jgi:hypothetical protein
MKNNQLWLLFPILLLIIISCSQNEEKAIITEKIQYDVNIKNTNSDYDPWIENISFSQRLEFVQNLMDAAYKGQVKAYDYFNNPLSLAELQNIGVDTIYKTLTRIYPPYEEFDTIIVSQINIQDINKIRFLEEWKMDKENLVFEKKVIGIAPVIDKFDTEGNFLGKQPLFWIYPEGKQN